MGQPHKHAEVIKAWADGAEIECRQMSPSGEWFEWGRVHNPNAPSWDATEYRIKPDPRAVRDMAIAEAVRLQCQERCNFQVGTQEQTRLVCEVWQTIVALDLAAIIATVKD